MRKMGVLALALMAILLIAGTGLTRRAGALEPGVHVDPGSPAAKQYALPLTEARTNGSGATGSDGHRTGTLHTPARNSEQVLFGAGIAPKHGASASVHMHSRHSPAMATQRAAQATARAQTTAGYANASARPPGGSDTLLALLGGGVAVLMVGALGGVVLRRSHSEHVSGG